MTKLIDCIERIPETIENILRNQEENFRKINEYVKDSEIDEIVFIASGSSYNSAFAAKTFIEKITGIRVSLIYPNNFIQYTHIYNKKALYILISQGGGTKLVYEAILKLKEMGLKTVSMTSDLESKISSISDFKLDMGCGYEEIIFRTLGYSSSLLNNFLLGLNIAYVTKKITKVELEKYLENIKMIPNNLVEINKITEKWYLNNRKELLENKKVVIIGADDLWAIAQEADIKIIETATYMTKSIELEEAIHGPQNGYTKDMNIFILIDKDKDFERANAIAKFCKNEVGNCYLVGNYSIDDRDLYFESVGKDFKGLEYISPFQILCHLLVEDIGRDITKPIYTTLSKYISKTF